MADRPPLTITIDGIAYPCSSWETVGTARELKRDWTQGWAGGMGQLTDVGDDSYYIAQNMDLSTKPYARLRPRFEASITVSPSGADPAYGFVATDGTWDFLYALSGTGSEKIALQDNGETWSKWDVVETKGFGASAVIGRPAFFEGVWHVPLGAIVDATRLATVNTPPTDDIWTTLTANTDDTALAFVVQMEEGTAKLWRAFDTNKVSATAAIGTAFAPTTGFEVGDSGEAIVDGISVEGNIIWSKPSSPYWFDEDGNSFAYQSFVGAGATLTNTDGVDMASHGPYAYWPHSSGFWRLFRGNALPVDFMSDPAWTGLGLDGLTPGFYGEWNSATAWQRWIYATAQNKLFYGFIRDDGSVHWHGELYYDSSSTVMRCFIVANPVTASVGPLLCVWDSGGTKKLNVIQLDQQGSLRSIQAVNTRRSGTASENGQLWLPYSTLGAPFEVQKRLRMIWVDMNEMPASDTVTLTARVDRDRAGTTTQVGSAVTAVGTGHYEFTPTTNSVDITSSSTADPTLITATAHGYQTGDIVTIAGHSSTPEINGEHVITRLTANTFTIPVNVTSGGGAAGTVKGTRDTFHEIMLSGKLAAGAQYNSALSDPRIRAMGMRAVTPHTYTAIIPVTPDGMVGSLGVKDALLKLRALKSGEGVPVLEPAFNFPFTGYVRNVQERVAEAQDAKMGYQIEVTIDRWVL